MPLHCACQNASYQSGYLKVAKYLITEHNYSPEHGSVDGYTPHAATTNDHWCRLHDKDIQDCFAEHLVTGVNLAVKLKESYA